MPSPQLLLQLRVPDEQPSRQVPLHDLDHVRDIELRLTVHQEVDVVRHDFHLPVLRAPYEMVLQRIDISTTICKVVLNSKINIFSHICIIPYDYPCVNANQNKCSFSYYT